MNSLKAALLGAVAGGLAVGLYMSWDAPLSESQRLPLRTPPVSTPAPSLPSVPSSPRVTRSPDSLDEQLQVLLQGPDDKIRRQFFDGLENLLSGKKIDAIQALLKVYREHYPRDGEATMLAADVLLMQGREAEAAEELLLALQRTGEPEWRTRLMHRLDLVVKSHASSLASLVDIDRLVAFYRRLLSIDPTRDRFRYMLVHWLEKQGQREEALTELNLVGHGVSAESIERMRLQIENTDNFEFTEAIAGRGTPQQLVLPVMIADVPVDLILDTGAELSVLTPPAVARLSGIEDTGRRVLLRTAGSDDVVASIIRVAKVQLGRQRLTDVSFAVVDMDLHPHGEGLLGMNVLSQFRFQIDPHALVLYLTPQESRTWQSLQDAL